MAQVVGLASEPVAGGGACLCGADGAGAGLRVSADLGARAIAEDATADLRHAATLSVVADPRELRRRA